MVEQLTEVIGLAGHHVNQFPRRYQRLFEGTSQQDYGPDGRLLHVFDTSIGWHRANFILASWKQRLNCISVGTIQNLTFTPLWVIPP